VSNPGYFYTPEDQEQADALQRRQAYARALLQQGGGDPGSAAYGGLRNAGNSIIGAFLSNKADKERRDLFQTAGQKYASDLASILNPKPEFTEVIPTRPMAMDGNGWTEMASRQASGAYDQGQRTPSTMEALARTGNPGLMQQFGPSLLEHQMNRQDSAADYQRDRADKAMRPATAEDKARAGIDPRTPAMVDAFGKIQPITDPNQITAYQQAEIANQKAQQYETVRHNKQDEEVKLHPFGIGVGGASTASGDEFLKSLPPGVAGQVKAIANYRQAPPANRTSAAGLALMNAVNQFNPSYDASQYGAKTKARNDFATGKNGNTVRSLNVAVQHLDQLGQLSDALANNNVQAFNKLGNLYATQTGSPAPTNFNAAKQLVGDEIVKAIVGAGGGVSDREEAAHNISAASSPQQLAGVIKTYQGLLSGQLVGLRQQYQKSTGLDDFEEYLAPETRAKLENHASGATAGGPPRKVVKFGDLP
jgi:hypothetical protein